jgi:ESF2/ABP1 family protein
MHAARLRLEISQSRVEQREYLKNVELARVLDKREERSQAAGKEFKRKEVNRSSRRSKERTTSSREGEGLSRVLENIF